jgi:hypothetical protein
MKLSSTLIVKSIFGEISGPEEMALQQLMGENPELIDDYISLVETSRELGRMNCSPSRSSVSIILEYSRQTAARREFAS